MRNGSAFTAVEDGDVVGFCTLTEKDELPAQYAISRARSAHKQCALPTQAVIATHYPLL